MLLITVGDHAMGQLAAAGVAAAPLVPLIWRDILHEGPVPAGLGLADLSRLRAGWIAAATGLPAREVEAAFAARDQALAAGAGDGAVLAFDHNLVNQLQLAQVLDWFASGRQGAGPLALVLVPSFAAAGPAELAAAFAARAPVGRDLLELGAAAWAAFRAPDPTAVEAVLPACDRLLPPLGAALRRHLQQFPATGDGLARSERQALATMAAAPGRRATLTELMHAQSAAEPLPFLGDSWLVAHLARLSAGETPLVRPAEAPGRTDAWVLTDAGAEVLAGRADRAELAAIDHWLGGVHLAGRPAWRWDRQAGRLAAA